MKLRRSGRVGPVVGLLGLVPLGPLFGQSRFGPDVALMGGIVVNSPPAFMSDQICPPRVAFLFGGRLGVSPAARIRLDLTTDLVIRSRGDDCVNGLVPPVPPQGPFERARVFYRPQYVGLPFAQTALRVSFVPFVRVSDEVRVHGELGRAWRAHLWVPGIGISQHIGRGPLRLGLEGSALWYSILRDSVHERYQDGQLVERIERQEPVGTVAFLLRVGLTIRGAGPP